MKNVFLTLSLNLYILDANVKIFWSIDSSVETVFLGLGIDFWREPHITASKFDWQALSQGDKILCGIGSA